MLHKYGHVCSCLPICSSNCTSGIADKPEITITQDPNKRYLQEQQSVKLTCTASGSPEPQVCILSVQYKLEKKRL